MKKIIIGSFLLSVPASFLLLFVWTASVFAEDNTTKPDLILLKSYQKQKNINIKNWLMSEKLDGVRAYWDGQALYSRNGNKFAAPEWFIEGFPDFELDGELWTKRGDFEQIVSIVKQHKPHDGWQSIRYQIFEVPNAAGDFTQRLNKIKFYLENNQALFINVIAQTICQGETHLQNFLSEIEQFGGEGIVVRDPQRLYHTGRSSASLKVKTVYDAECIVTGYTEGKGKYKGLTGALICQTNNKQILTIGSGLSHKERKHPPAINTTITYQYYGLTASGKPRFPVYLRVR